MCTSRLLLLSYYKTLSVVWFFLLFSFHFGGLIWSQENGISKSRTPNRVTLGVGDYSSWWWWRWSCWVKRTHISLVTCVQFVLLISLLLRSGAVCTAPLKIELTCWKHPSLLAVTAERRSFSVTQLLLLVYLLPCPLLSVCRVVVHSKKILSSFSYQAKDVHFPFHRQLLERREQDTCFFFCFVLDCLWIFSYPF